MILRRLGNKQRIAERIIQFFPKHDIYVEPFFGAGGIFFNKPKVKSNIVNDLDSEVFNLWQIVSDKEKYKELKRQLYIMPVSEDLFNYWKTHKETDPYRKAVRLLFFAHSTYLTKGTTFLVKARDNSKKVIYDKIDKVHKLLFDVIIANMDFRKFINSLSFRSVDDRTNTFIYCDPPYLSTKTTYESFTEQDTVDLFDCLEKTKCKFAVSEFNHPFILEQAKTRNLNVIYIGERVNLKNRRTEILVTNFKNETTLFNKI
jgi:DNA adenine methylase